MEAALAYFEDGHVGHFSPWTPSLQAGHLLGGAPGISSSEKSRVAFSGDLGVRARPSARARAGRSPRKRMGVAVGHDDREHQARRRVELARRGSALCDGNIDPIGVVRLEGAASRAGRALQLDRRPEPEPMRSRNISPPMALLSPGRRASRQAGVGTAPSRETRRTARRPTGKGHPARRPRPPTTEAASDQDRAP